MLGLVFFTCVDMPPRQTLLTDPLAAQIQSRITSVLRMLLIVLRNLKT